MTEVQYEPIVEEFSEDAKVFLLGLFADGCGYARSDFIQMRIYWHFYGAVIGKQPRTRIERLPSGHILGRQANMDHSKCEILATVAAYLHDVLGITRSTVMRWFDEGKLLDKAFVKLKEAGKFDLFLKEAEVIHVSVAKDGSVLPIILH